MADLEALSALCPDEMAKTRKEAVRNKGLTESAANMLAIQSDLYRFWKAGLIALRPLPPSSSEEENNRAASEIQMEFYWLSQLIDMAADDEIWKGRVRNAMNITEWSPQGHDIKSGYVFTIRSENPRHLPSRPLLELQWGFSCMAAVTGARGYHEY